MGFSRVTWGMSALVWIIVGAMWCVWWGLPAIAVAIVFLILPDISLIGAFAERGRLHPNRVAFYNLMHNVAVPAALIVVGVAIFLITGGIEHGFWGIAFAGLAWFVHIALDRVFGFGLRAEDGSIIPVT